MSINDIKISSDSQIMSVALSNGYAAYTLEPLQRKLQHVFLDQQFGIVSTIPDSMILVCSGVKGQDPFSDQTVCVYDETISRVILEIQMPDPVKNIVMYPNMFAIVTSKEVRVYTFDPPILYCQFRTADNSFGPCDFYCPENDFLIAMVGRDSYKLRIVCSQRRDNQDFQFDAHTHAISAIKFCKDASLVATTSNLGTIIRIFKTQTGEQIAELRRGTGIATIKSMAFSFSMDMIAISSNKSTLHIFALSNDYSSALTAQRSIAQWKLPKNESPTVTFLKNGMLLAVFPSGDLYVLEVVLSEQTCRVKQILNYANLLDAR